MEGGDVSERSHRPQQRNIRFSTRENSAYKWKEDKTVIGALEVKSEPQLDYTAKLREKKVMGVEDEFKECLQIWKEGKMRKSFIDACALIPPKTSCCGLIPDQDETVRTMVEMLNEGWAIEMNKSFEDKGYNISAFVWSWNNPSGKAQTVVLLIRFHTMIPHRK